MLAFTDVWFGYSLHDAAFPLEPVVGAVGAFTGWLLLDCQSLGERDSGASLHPHDRALGNQLRAIFDQRTLRFLKEQPFGQPFRGDLIRNLEELADDWEGANYEFEDTELDNGSAKIVRQARELCKQITEYAGAATNWPEGHISVPLDAERGADMFSDLTWERIGELRRLASSLEAYHKFEKAFRRLAPGEYESADR